MNLFRFCGMHAGGMHAGYPIMSDVTVSVTGHQSVKITNMQMYTEGAWDALRELGHNQQRSGWDFPPHTTDATCYLWSIYVNETVLEIPREKAHPDLDPNVRKKRVKDYIQGGAQLKDFTAWTALEPYLTGK
ncbi:Hypothetical predicted protein [Podarcis lilfordi]|uniref:Peptidase M60 domain-containing protein n=1 Tax=Podarcis lilfordi TaxID=74358 RepID=A0AA35KZN6_9SAUR|nr:Hypothetical predicted protein [Podarcis lilfordi]